MATFFAIKSLYTNKRSDERKEIAAFLLENPGARLYLYDEKRGALKILQYLGAKGTISGVLVEGAAQREFSLRGYGEILRKDADLRADLALLLGPMQPPLGKPAGIGR